MDACGSLNHFYRTVWNAALGAMVAVAEIAGSRGKSGRGASQAHDGRNRKLSHLRLAPVATAVALAWLASPAALLANPTGGVAIQGQATFTTNGNKLLVTTQNGAGLNHSAINWQSFSIPTGSTTFFQQPSVTSTSINRVISNNPSQIFGTLGSNGNLVLVNQSGITVGAGAVVDTAGFTASALRMSDADALAGRLRFGDATAPGNVSVLGNVLARSGDVVVLGAQVDTGSAALIQAPNGSTILGAGQQVEITGRGLEGIVMQVQAPSDSAINLGTLKGDAVGIFAGTLKHSGLIQANTVSNEGGRVVLRAQRIAEVDGAVSASGTSGGAVDISVEASTSAATNGTIIQSGTLDASATVGTGGMVRLTADSILSGAAIHADGQGAGGHVVLNASQRAISTSASQVSANGGQGSGGEILVSAKVSNFTSGSYSATGAIGGTITLAGDEIKVVGGQLDASGRNGGGSLHVGGLMRGAPGFASQGQLLSNALSVYSSGDSVYRADALERGNGGQVILWSDGQTRFNGSISAQGGQLGGNGGSAEISGKEGVGYGGVTNLSASNGVNGTLLLDPKNITIVAGNAGLSGGSTVPYLGLENPNAGTDEAFGGYQNLTMSNGAIVVNSPLDSFAATHSGAVYFYSASGVLNGALVGTGVEDRVGSGYVHSFGGDKLLILSPQWGSAGVANNGLGAVTWANGATGALSSGTIGGTVGASNSLVGAITGDRIGLGSWGMVSGNVFIANPQWGSGGNNANAIGAITWMNGATGALSNGLNGGQVGAANSVVGSAAGDGVGTSFNYEVAAGNYIARSANWGSAGVAANAKGAVTWINGLTGKLSDGTSAGGVISSGNSLIGSTAGDKVGTFTYSIYDQSGLELVGSNLLISSNNWNNGGSAEGVGAGAVTWMNGTNGHLSGGAFGGVVSASNSLVGSSAGDRVGTAVYSYSASFSQGLGLDYLNNGNYLVRSGLWGSAGTTANAKGAVTWFDTANGTTGVVSSANSIVGTTAGDQVGVAFSDAFSGHAGVVTLNNGHYVVISSNWGGGKGAVTWGNGSVGTSGEISGVAGPTTGLAPSLVGNLTTDRVGALGISAQYYGSNFLVKSPWLDSTDPNSNVIADVGALTWVNGVNGILADGTSRGGIVSASNSLIGNFAYDNVGSSAGVQLLDSENFLALTRAWGSGQLNAVDAIGAVTWINGGNGQLSNGSPMGATVTSANSLVGGSIGDLTNPIIYASQPSGNLFIQSSSFTNTLGNSSAANAGSVTWMRDFDGHLADALANGGAAGGVVSAANSLVGSVAGSQVGSGGVAALANDKVLIKSPNWSGLNGDTVARTNAGAVTWMDGATGQLSDNSYFGIVSGTNSLIGSTAQDQVGGGYQLIHINHGTGNVLVRSTQWDNGSVVDAGAVTWMDATNGRLSDNSTGGVITSTNSLVSDIAATYFGEFDPVELNNGPVGVGLGAVVLRSTRWDNYKGAVTWMSTADGSLNNGLKGGVISNSNSLVGAAANDYVGNASYDGVTLLANRANYLVHSSMGGLGALTWVNGATGLTHNGAGTITTANSLMGAAGDAVGSSTVTTLLGNNNVVLTNTFWGGGYGSVTWMNGVTGQLKGGALGGLVSAANSLVGTSASDQIGSAGILPVSTGDYFVSSPHWANGAALDAGAVTLGNGANGATIGAISATNSLVGTGTGDAVGWSVMPIGGTRYLVASPQWGSNGVASNALGAITWIDAANNKVGPVSASNSLVGSNPGDIAGGSLNSGWIYSVKSNGNLIIQSPDWNGGRSALTWMNGATGALSNGSFGGAISASNSLLGSNQGDKLGQGDIYELANGNWVIASPYWGYGANQTSGYGLGAATWINGSTGRLADSTSGGMLTAANSLVGNVTGDAVGGLGNCDCSFGGGITTLSNGNYIVNSPSFQQNAGALTWGDGATGLVGTITSANSVTLHISYLSEIGSTGKALIAQGTGVGQVYLLGMSGSAASPTFGGDSATSATIGAGNIAATLGAGTNVVLQANNDITISSDISVAPITQGLGGNLTLQAGRSILVNANITTSNGSVTLVANETAVHGVVDANRDPGAASLSLAAGVSLNAGTGLVSLQLLDGAGNTHRTVGTLSQGLGSSILASGLSVVSYGGADLSANNTVTNFQASNTGTAGLKFNNIGDLILGQPVGLGVVNSGGVIKVAASGNLSLAASPYGVVSSGAAGDAIVLSTGGVFSDNGNALSATNGRWLVYSVDPGINSVTANPLTATGFKQFAYAAGAQPAQATGNGFIYSLAPTLNASLTGTMTRAYNGTTQYALDSANFVVTNSLDNTDVITVAPQMGDFDSKNATVSTTVNGVTTVTSGATSVTATGMTVASAVDSAGAKVYGYQITGPASGIGSITPASIALTAPSISKTYDGNTTYTTQTADLAALSGALFAGDTVTAATLSYADKNAGAGNKAVSLNAATINDGNGGANYTVTALNGNSSSTINPLTQVTWSSAVTSGNWSDPASWTGNLVPDGANVLAVSVLNGATVTYDLAAPTTVQAINMTGSFTMSTGSLAVTGSLNTPQFTQTGGALTGTGSLTVTNGFSQSAGSIAMDGAVSITQTSGNLAVGSVTAPSIALQAISGTVTQTAALSSTGLLQVSANGGIDLSNANNAVRQFAASNAGSGNVRLVNTGALDVRGVSVAAGTVDIQTHSPLSVNSSVTASGNITLAALTPDGTSNITINAPVTSTAGGISIQAYNNFIQNSGLNAALGIDVSTIAGSMLFGPGAFSVGNPVSYSVNGVAYMPPWIASSVSGGANDFVVTFLDQFLAVLDTPLGAMDDPLGLRLRGQEGVVVEGEICKP